MSTLYIWKPDLSFDDGGSFGNERDEDIMECPDCNGVGYFEDLSECCGDDRDPDTGLCFSCHEHCGPTVCDRCNGTGLL